MILSDFDAFVDAASRVNQRHHINSLTRGSLKHDVFLLLLFDVACALCAGANRELV